MTQSQFICSSTQPNKSSNDELIKRKKEELWKKIFRDNQTVRVDFGNDDYDLVPVLTHEDMIAFNELDKE